MAIKFRAARLAAMLLASCSVTSFSADRAAAQQAGQQRNAIVEEVRNPNQAFQVRVTPDHADHVYEENDELKVTVRSSQDGYLYLLYKSTNGQLKCLFPNSLQSENFIKKNTDTHVPPQADATFRIRIAAPFGQEVLKAVVTRNRLKLDDDKLRKQVSNPVSLEQVKDAVVEAVGAAPAAWAEHSVVLVTKEKKIAPPPARRVGLFIGVGKYQDRGIRPLDACGPDAVRMMNTMKTHCGVTEAFLLLDKDATLANIVAHIREKLVAATRPGDTVFIYWSGHGGRCADDNGDEKDGLDEFLVTYDTKLGDADTLRNTSLLDDAFGRILQDLDGRKIAVILDTCHSGGQANNEKGLQGLDGVKALGDVDMFDNDVRRTKDIGQKDTALLVSSRAAQISFVRKTGELSVMTKVLDDVIREGNGPLTLADAATRLKKLVPTYISENFPGATQTPELIDDTNPSLLLRK